MFEGLGRKNGDTEVAQYHSRKTNAQNFFSLSNNDVLIFAFFTPKETPWTSALGVALEYVFVHGRMKLGRNSCDTSVFEYTVSNGDDLYCPQDKLLHTLVTNLVASSSVLQLFKSNTERSYPNIKLYSGESPYCVRIVLYPDCFN